jgi:hypothetical protein
LRATPTPSAISIRRCSPVPVRITKRQAHSPRPRFGQQWFWSLWIGFTAYRARPPARFTLQKF